MWRRETRLERALRAQRPEAREELVDDVVRRLDSVPRRGASPRRARLVLASVLIVTMVAVAGSFGSFSYAAHLADSTRHVITKVVKKPAKTSKAKRASQRTGGITFFASVGTYQPGQWICHWGGGQYDNSSRTVAGNWTPVQLTSMAIYTAHTGPGHELDYGPTPTQQTSASCAAGSPGVTFGVSVSSPQTAGTPFSVTITAIVAGETNVTYTGSHAVTFSGPGNAPNGAAPTYPATVTFVNGVATPTITLRRAETTTLTVTEPSPSTTGTSGTFTVNAAAASQMALVNCSTTPSGSTSCASPFTLANPPSSMTASIEVRDPFGNPVTGSRTINLSMSGDGSRFSFTPGSALLTTSVTVASGNSVSGPFSVHKRTGVNSGGTVTVTATSTGLTPLSFNVTKP